MENASNIFERANKVPEAQVGAEAKQEMLLQEVGQLQIENRFLKKVQAIVLTRAEAVELDNKEGMSISEQCRILEIHRSAYYYQST